MRLLKVALDKSVSWMKNLKNVNVSCTRNFCLDLSGLLILSCARPQEWDSHITSVCHWSTDTPPPIPSHPTGLGFKFKPQQQTAVQLFHINRARLFYQRRKTRGMFVLIVSCLCGLWLTGEYELKEGVPLSNWDCVCKWEGSLSDASSLSGNCSHFRIRNRKQRCSTGKSRDLYREWLFSSWLIRNKDLVEVYPSSMGYLYNLYLWIKSFSLVCSL